MEADEKIAQKTREVHAAQDGRSFAHGIMGHSPEVENKVMRLPCNVSLRKPLQDTTTGQPFFMLGVDSLS